MPKDSDVIEMTFYWNVDCAKEHVWEIITNWNDASWVMGSPKTEIIDMENKIQRRTWENGYKIDVRMVSENKTTWTAVEETVGGLVFPDVTYETFFVTISLSDDGVDPDTQTRIRYHVTATLSRGTFEQGRESLKADFYGPRIKFYQKYFNCSKPINAKKALRSIEKLHQKINSIERTLLKTEITNHFEKETDDHSDECTISSLESFWSATFGKEDESVVQLKNVIPIFVLPDLRVISIEDITTSNILTAKVNSRIVIYQLNEHGKIVNARIFDRSVSEITEANNYLSATDHYYDILTLRDIEKIRLLYSKDAVLEDPVGYFPPRSFDSVYTNFIEQTKSFIYTRSPERTYVCKNQVAQLVLADFILQNDNPLRSYPIQIFTFDEQSLITRFEAFFKPKVLDFSKFK